MEQQPTPVFLAGEFLGERSLEGYSSWDHRVRHGWTTFTLTPGGAVMKNPPARSGGTRDMDSIPRSGKSPEGGYGNPLRYSYLENPVDRGVWQVTVYGVAKSWTWLSEYTHINSYFLFHRVQIDFQVFLKLWLFDHLNSLVTWVESALESFVFQIKKKTQKIMGVRSTKIQKYWPQIWLLKKSHNRFPGGSDGKASAYNVGDPGSIPGLGRSPGEGNGNPLQYSCLENSMDGGDWWATVHGVTKSRTRLSDFTRTISYTHL